MSFFDEALATMETRAHLELLVLRGSLRKDGSGEQVVYTRP